MNIKTEIMNFLEANNWFSLGSKENAEGVVNCYLKSFNLQSQQGGAIAHCNIDLVEEELEYVSPITKATTKFKVADVFVNIFNVNKEVYGEVFAVSKNGNKYKIDEFSEVRVPQ